MFVNKYKDAVLDLQDADNNTFYFGKNEIVWIWGRDGGWTILESMMWKEFRIKTYPVFGNFVHSTETAVGRNCGWDVWT